MGKDTEEIMCHHKRDEYWTHSLGRAEVRRLSTQSSVGESHTDIPNLVNKTTHITWLSKCAKPHNVLHKIWQQLSSVEDVYMSILTSGLSGDGVW